MKKNKMFILGLLTLFVAVLSLSLVSGTYAKYTSTTTGSDTAKVAKWSWEVNSTDLPNATNLITFDLFNTIKDTADGSDESDVKSGLIAPGTKGSFVLDIKNLSEVNGTIKVIVKVYHESHVQYMPIELRIEGVDGTTNTTATESEKSVIFESNLTTLAMESGNKQVTVNWQWQFESGHDDLDTQLGVAEPNFTAECTLIFTQVD